MTIFPAVCLVAACDLANRWTDWVLLIKKSCGSYRLFFGGGWNPQEVELAFNLKTLENSDNARESLTNYLKQHVVQLNG